RESSYFEKTTRCDARFLPLGDVILGEACLDSDVLNRLRTTFQQFLDPVIEKSRRLLSEKPFGFAFLPACDMSLSRLITQDIERLIEHSGRDQLLQRCLQRARLDSKSIAHDLVHLLLELSTGEGFTPRNGFPFRTHSHGDYVPTILDQGRSAFQHKSPSSRGLHGPCRCLRSHRPAPFSSISHVSSLRHSWLARLSLASA